MEGQDGVGVCTHLNTIYTHTPTLSLFHSLLCLLSLFCVSLSLNQSPQALQVLDTLVLPGTDQLDVKDKAAVSS